jgi:Na+/melibiose symporter-like transporter
LSNQPYATAPPSRPEPPLSKGAERRDAPPLSRPVKLAFGFGAVAPGITAAAFDFFLLIFYSQVVGLEAQLVGLAIMVSLIFDAISDPIVGYWSDNLRSRWGRRHPFLYVSAIPMAASFYFLWTPPENASQSMLFWYLLSLSVIVRLTVTIYRTPSSALVPDLTQDYNERTALYGLRYFLAWIGGNGVSVWMFAVLFPMFATATISDGRFNRDAYPIYGMVGALFILLSIVVSAVGTHSRIPYLKPAPPKRQLTIRLIFGELIETLSNRSFLSLFAAAMLAAIAGGLAAGLSLYFFTYFWAFDERQTGAIFVGTFIAAGIGLVLAPRVSRKLGKKRGAIIVGLVAFVGAPVPIILRLLDLLPPNGTPFIFWFVTITNIIDVGLIICFQILFASMLADLVEDSELITGRRSEGVFVAAETFIEKSVRGVGVMGATTILTLAGLPSGAKVNEVSADAIWWMGAYYVPTVLALWIAMIAVISSYRIDKTKHEETLRKLGA